MQNGKSTVEIPTPTKGGVGDSTCKMFNTVFHNFALQK